MPAQFSGTFKERMVREFFKSWRRKGGCLVLMMACMAATAWCRSLTVQDLFQHVSHDQPDRVSGMTIRQITSDSGTLSWETVTHFEDFLDSAVPESGWFSRSATESDVDGYGGLCRQRFGWSGFGIAEGNFGRSQIWRWAAPYWSMAIPLTLLSAYLILRKPRKAK